MIRPIVTDKEQLCIPSLKVYGGPQLDQILLDLVDTAEHHRTKGKIGCVGLAANQIGELARAIAVWMNNEWILMINPTVEIRPGKWGQAHEGCLSRPGVRRKIKRAKRIKVQYWNQEEDLIEQKLTGFPARIVQHEVDHLDGVFI